MKKILILFLFFLSSCGYQSLYSTKNKSDYIFKQIETSGERSVNEKLISALQIKIDYNNYNFEKLILENSKNIVETSKNSKGQPDSYKMIISVKMQIKDKGISKEKNLIEEFAYGNLENKFDLKEYEKNIEKNLLNKIVEQLVIHLNL